VFWRRKYFNEFRFFTRWYGLLDESYRDSVLYSCLRYSALDGNHISGNHGASWGGGICEEGGNSRKKKVSSGREYTNRDGVEKN